MRQLAHISDLHFGKTDPAIVAALREHLLASPPDLLIVTGDVTQRGKKRQFLEARAFLDSLPFARLVVPGNHDLAPIYRPLLRARDPYRNYRQLISANLNARFEDDELLVLGLNTAHPLRPTEGTVTRGQIAWLLSEANRARDRVLVVAAHHPLLETSVRPLKRRVRGATALLPALERVAAALILAGHLHESFSGPAAARLGAEESVVVVQSSTTTSTRLRGHLNAYNRIAVDKRRIQIDVNVWNGSAFTPARRLAYARRDQAWVTAEAAGDSTLS